MPYKNEEDRIAHSKSYYLANKNKILRRVKKYYLNNWARRSSQKKEWDLKNREKMRQYRKKYYKEYLKTPKGKEIFKKSYAKYAKKNIHKRKCYGILLNALRTGIKIKPKKCFVCKKETMLHGHHTDYNKPLDVIWCCSLCHKKIHQAGIAKK